MRLRDEVVGNRRLIEHGGRLRGMNVQRRNEEVPKSTALVMNQLEV